MRTGLSLVMISSLTLVLTASAATHYVVPPGTPGVATAPNYTSWATAATNIAHAVSVATNNSLVLVSNGSYRLSGTLTIATGITLRSFKAGATDRVGTILDGGFPIVSNRCIYVNNAAAVIDGFTITNGYAPATSLSGNGGGVYFYQKGTLTNCVVAGNVAAASGGGIYLYGDGRVTGCTLAGNIATNAGMAGGGAYAFWGGVLTNCLIRGNRSHFGGGVYLYGPQPTVGSAALLDCDVFENTAVISVSGEGGGGIYQYRKSMISDCQILSNKTVKLIEKTPYGAGLCAGEGGVVRNCLIAYNSGATYGGGVASIGRGRVVTNCVIRNNSAAIGGGVETGTGGLLVDSVVVSNNTAVFVQGGTIRNCLIAFNGSGIRDFTVPGGIFQNCTIVGNGNGLDIGYSTYVPTSIVENCILYHNGASGINFTKTAVAGLIVSNSCIWPMPTGLYNSGVITNTPRLVNYPGYDFRLRGSSPCINKGVYRTWMAGARDLARGPRIRGDAVDIGAFEHKPLGTSLQVR